MQVILKKKCFYLKNSFTRLPFKDTLKEDIKEARKAAEDYVREFYASLKNDSKKAVRGAWDEMKVYLIFCIIMTFIVMVVMTCSGCQSPAERLAELNSMDYSALLTEGLDKPSDLPAPRKMPAMQVNDVNHWISHTFFNAFSLKVPVTVELQTKDSPYVRQITSKGCMRRHPSKALTRH